MIQRRLFTFASAFLILTGFVFSQAPQRDWVVWLGASAEKKLWKKGPELSLGFQHRRDNNASEFKAIFGEANLSYKVNDYFTAAGGIRYSIKNPGRTTRYYADFTGSYDLKLEKWKITPSLRLRFQYDHESMSQSFFAFRTKFKLKFDRKKLPVSPWIGIENYDTYKYDSFVITRYRFSLGANYEITKDIELSFQYIFQRELNKRYPVQSNIASLSLSYSF